MITHASTFSGIGASEIAAQMLGWSNMFHCEINHFGRKVLDYHFPDSESYEDITKTDFSKYRGRITVLTGGFPCQPFSYAGKRRGTEDDRYLWPYMLRCIEQVRPTWFVGENVAGITTMVFPGKDVKVGEQATVFGTCDQMERRERYVIEEICQQLEDIGYSVQPMLIPACAVGAPHRRDRIFFIAHRNDVADTYSRRMEGRSHNGEQCDQRTERQSSEDNQQRGAWDKQGRNEESTENRPTPNPSCSGSEAQEPCGWTESNGSDRLSQPSQRRDTSKRTDGLSAVQGTDTHPDLQRPEERNIPEVTSKEERFTCKEDIDWRDTKSSNADVADTKSQQGDGLRHEKSETRKPKPCQLGGGDCEDGGGTRADADTENVQCNGCRTGERHDVGTRSTELGDNRESAVGDIEILYPNNRWRTFPTVSPVYRGNDGLPFDVDNLTIPFSEWKRESIKAYGNAIVVQVIYMIFKYIDELENN